MKLLLQVAAVLQVSILIASALTPRVFDWRKNLAVLHPFLRKLFWVYGVFIVMVIVAFAALTFLHADAMAAREPVARSLCVFIAIFWGARLFVQFAVFDLNSVVATALCRRAGASTERGGYIPLLRFGYYALTIIFAFLVLVYGKAAL
jgi:hypothetical protein